MDTKVIFLYVEQTEKDVQIYPFVAACKSVFDRLRQQSKVWTQTLPSFRLKLCYPHCKNDFIMMMVWFGADSDMQEVIDANVRRHILSISFTRNTTI